MYFILYILLFLLLLFTPSNAFASICDAHNGVVTIDGTLMPDMHNCPINVSNGEGESTHVTVKSNSNPQPTSGQQTQTVIQVVVTATPTVIPVKSTRIYRKPTVTPTFTPTPTATPSATPTPKITPIPTSKPTFLKSIQSIWSNVLNFFHISKL
jgi:hypothetical protein